MTKHIKSRKASAPSAVRSSLSSAMQAFVTDSDGFDCLRVPGYSTLLSSPDVAAAVSVVADIISSATIHLMKNSDGGDVRVKNELSKFMDIRPYSLGTRKTFIAWIVSTLLSAGDGNAFVLPVTRNGYLEDLVPMPGANAVGVDNSSSYLVHWRGLQFAPDEVLHFILEPDLDEPWRGRGVRVQLKDVLQNLRQSAATTNSFLSDKWKPSVIVKVDALAEEFEGQAGREKLLQNYVATQGAGKPWVIPADLFDVVTVKPLSLADLALNDSVTLDKRAVAAAIGVPPFTIGVGDYDQDEFNGFIRRRVIPIAAGIAQELTKKLLISPEMFFRVNARKLYAYSYEQLAKVGDDQYVRGIMTGNEVRDWLDLSPRKGLDELVMLENYIPAGMIGDQKKLTKEGKNNAE